MRLVILKRLKLNPRNLWEIFTADIN